MQQFLTDASSALQPVQRLAQRLRATRPAPARGPIGLEFGTDHLHLAQMDFRGARPHLRAAVSRPYDPGRDALLADAAQLKSFLRDCSRGAGFGGSEVVTCMPSEQVKLVQVNYQLQRDDSEAEVVLARALERVDGEPANWIVDYLPIRCDQPDTAERSALAALAREADVFRHLEHLRRAGLVCQAMEISPVAIWRMVKVLNGPDHSHGDVLVINLGRRSTYLTVLSGRRLVMDREVDFGEDGLTAKLAGVLDTDAASAARILQLHGVDGPGARDAGDPGEIRATIAQILKPEFRRLAEEVGKVLVYVASMYHGSSVSHVYLLGGVLRVPGIERLLGSMLGLPVSALNPLAFFDQQAQIKGLEPHRLAAGFSIAIGCSLRGWQGYE